MAVYLKKTINYNIKQIEWNILEGLSSLGINLQGKKTALLKPNIVIPAKPDSGIITNPAFVHAVINVLRKNGIEKIFIGEGPGIGLEVGRVFEASGYKKMSEKLGVELIDLHGAERVKKKWHYGTIEVPKILEEIDLYINIPKMKTHGYTKVTLSIKNQKGLVSPETKRQIHQLGLHGPIIEQMKIFKPDLIIVDGIVGLEGDGPLNGSKIQSGIIAMGVNLVEVDSICARLMGFDPSKIEHLKIAYDEKLGDINPVVLGDKISDLAKNFKKANEVYGHILNVYSWRNIYACSMCIDSFSMAVKAAIKNPRYWFSFIPKFMYLALFKKIDILQGKNAKLPCSPGLTICLGNCTKKFADENKLLNISGCPPKPEDIIRAFIKKE